MTVNDGFRKWYDEFRSSSRVYKREKTQLTALQQKYRDVRDAPTRERELMELLRQDTEFVEQILETVRKKSGEEAVVLILDLYVDSRKQNDVAQAHGISRRQLQYSVDKFLKEAYSNEQG